jgi:hypothetical protein
MADRRRRMQGRAHREKEAEGGDRVRCGCWEIDVLPAEVENMLSKMRAENAGVLIQAFRMRSPPNCAAVEMIATQTLAVARTPSTLAEKPELDLLLRLAGTRQIGDAFKRIGYKKEGVEQGDEEEEEGGAAAAGHGKTSQKLFMVAASGQGEDALSLLLQRIAGDRRFKPVPKRPLGKADLEAVERAALLAA